MKEEKAKTEFKPYDKKDWTLVPESTFDINQKVAENDKFYGDIKLKSAIKIGELSTDDGQHYDVTFPFYLYSQKDNPVIYYIGWGDENDEFPFVLENEQTKNINGLAWYDEQHDLNDILVNTDFFLNATEKQHNEYSSFIDYVGSDSGNRIYELIQENIETINKDVYDGKDMSDVFKDKILIINGDNKDSLYAELKHVTPDYLINVIEHIENGFEKTEIDDIATKIMAIEKHFEIVQKELAEIEKRPTDDIKEVSDRNELINGLDKEPHKVVQYLEQFGLSYTETLNYMYEEHPDDKDLGDR